MKTEFLQNLYLRLCALTVFRPLLSDPVIAALSRYLACSEENKPAAVSAYSAFIAKLYESESGSLAAYVKEITEACETVYVRMLGCGKTPDEQVKKSVSEELKTLQMVADLTAADLQTGLEGACTLPGFTAEKVNLRECFTERTKNIGKYGYGAYAKHAMFYVDAESRLVPVLHPDATQLSDLYDYERERNLILENTKALLAGKPAANILLTGDAGTGKSSTIKAAVNALFSEGLRIVEVRKEQLTALPGILDELSLNPLKFILFIDDLSFSRDDDCFSALKAVLEGSVSAKSKNVVIYATSNRRHIVKERFSDREGDEIHRNDTMQELISLSERFGLHITFSKPDKKTFLSIMHQLAEKAGIKKSEEELDLLAERFALSRGGRSPRLAKQFVDGLVAAEQ